MSSRHHTDRSDSTTRISTISGTAMGLLGPSFTTVMSNSKPRDSRDSVYTSRRLGAPAAFRLKGMSGSTSLADARCSCSVTVRCDPRRSILGRRDLGRPTLSVGEPDIPRKALPAAAAPPPSTGLSGFDLTLLMAKTAPPSGLSGLRRRRPSMGKALPSDAEGRRLEGTPSSELLRRCIDVSLLSSDIDLDSIGDGMLYHDNLSPSLKAARFSSSSMFAEDGRPSSSALRAETRPEPRRPPDRDGLAKRDTPRLSGVAMSLRPATECTDAIEERRLDAGMTGVSTGRDCSKWRYLSTILDGNK
mmetsp:Transcript_300/g.966  ORF Transcript_300/g.966 Transcript_300/m.966 type:complete len:303 (-) Transcript_300:1541-2449(-)